jgi:hypothetical protein
MKAPVEKNKEYEFYIEGMGFQGVRFYSKGSHKLLI